MSVNLLFFLGAYPWSTGNGSDDKAIDFGSIHPPSPFLFFKAGFDNEQKLLGNS